MSERLAVVGTDTGVGKTVVTAGLTARLREAGVDARAIKPVQTGPDDDAGEVARVCADSDAAACLRSLDPPLAPRVAAEREGAHISYDALRAECERALEAQAVGILEGVGGLRVPLTADREVLDLVADLDCAAILVARSSLGTLNHTALSVDALSERGVPVRAVVCNEYVGESVAERTNPVELERMTGLPVRTVPSVRVDRRAEVIDAVGSALSPVLESIVERAR